MRKICIAIIILVLTACKHKEANLNSDAPIKPNEFIAAFDVLENGFAANDSNILRLADTVTINHKLLARFIPDTLINRLTNGDNKTTFHPVGRIDKTSETYLLLLSIRNRKPIATAIVLDKKNVFLGDKDLLNTQLNDNNYRCSFSLNREPTFFVTREKTVNEKEIKYTKTGWAYNGKTFIAVLKESNERDEKLIAIQNPLDTFARENMYSGNYVEDERNFISIRDGKTKQEYLFFLHIDKNDGKCVGELKGEMKMTDSLHAIYSFAGDPCIIDFTFDRNIITIKEKGSCGNRRGMDCFFEDAYTKKKEVKKKIIKPTVIKMPVANVTKMLLPAKPALPAKKPAKITNKPVAKETIKKVEKPTNTAPKKDAPKKDVPKKAAPKEEENPYAN